MDKQTISCVAIIKITQDIQKESWWISMLNMRDSIISNNEQTNSNSSQTSASVEQHTVESPGIIATRNEIYKTEFDENGRAVKGYGTIYPQSNDNEYMRSIREGDKMVFTSHGSSQYSMIPKTNMHEIDFREGMKELNEIIGLGPVKKFVEELVSFVEIGKERERVGQNTPTQSLHTIFTGNPGTGKTTVARIFGKIMRGLNVIKGGQFVEVTREDLVEEHIGGTAPKTRQVLESALGGVLFIDEVYALMQSNRDDFGREAISTIVKFMEDHTNELIVIIAGYTKETNEFLKANSGLKSRFPNTIEFPDYTPNELFQITKGMVQKQDFRLTPTTEKAVLEILTKKQINGRNDTGNGRLARNLLQSAVRKQSQRLKEMKVKTVNDYYLLLPSDFDYKTDIEFDLEGELAKVIGNEEIKQFVRNLQAEMVIREQRKKHGLTNNQQSLHMIFKGNPGTGKTTIARIMGRMLKELGVVKSGHLVEVTREDLVAGYVGQTEQKTRDKIQEALGGILFIDEVYSLNGGGENDFGQQAINVLVKQMEEHYENLIVIIAGYEDETNEFLQTNSGLKSRFPYQFTFKDYTVIEMAQIAIMLARKEGYILPKDCYKDLLLTLQQGVGRRDSGNGRFARNVIDKARLNLSTRLTKAVSNHITLTKENLQTFKPEDFCYIKR